MERLTQRIDEHYIARLDRLNGKIVGNQMCMDKLGAIEDLEEQGLLLRLPCKVGTLVYQADCILGIGYIDEHRLKLEDISEFGKTVFLTKDEAKQKSEEMEDKY